MHAAVHRKLTENYEYHFRTTICERFQVFVSLFVSLSSTGWDSFALVKFSQMLVKTRFNVRKGSESAKIKKMICHLVSTGNT